MAVPEHLTIATDALQFEALLMEWRWLVPLGFVPGVMTAFGNLFLCGPTIGIRFLDLMWGEFKQVAASEEKSGRLWDDQEQRRRWFVGFLLREVRKVCGDQAAGECYRCTVPLSLGGPLHAGNFERMDLQVHDAILGQLHQQARHLPPGTKIDHIKSELPQQATRPRRWWQRILC